MAAFNSLEILIEPLIRSRLESLFNELLKSNSYYLQLSNERDQYFKQLQESIPDELQHAMFLYEDAQMSLQTIQQLSIYLQGFKDAMQLYNEVNIQ